MKNILYLILLSLTLNSCSSDESAENNDFYISFKADGEEFKESGSNNSFSSFDDHANFAILKGDINLTFHHTRIRPTLLVGKEVYIDLENGEFRTEYMDNQCFCHVESAEKAGDIMNGFGQPYRVTGLFGDCKYSKEDGSEVKEITEGEFDIIVYYLLEKE